MQQRFSIREFVARSSVLRRLCSERYTRYLPENKDDKGTFFSLTDSEFVGRCSRYLFGDIPENESFRSLQRHLKLLGDRISFFKSIFYSEESFTHRSLSKISLPSEDAYPFKIVAKDVRKLLVVSNCQTFGLANCLSLHCENVLVEACDMWTFQKKSDYWMPRLGEFDQIFGSQGPELDSLIDFGSYPKTLLIPGFHMECYHKDLTYCWQGETRLKTPLDDYHSRICLTAYRRGASVEETVKLFNANTYREIGYFSDWEKDREAFISMYAAYGLDVREVFLDWVRKGYVPHSINHPTIAMLSDLARVMAEKVGLPSVNHAIVPHDNLAQGPIFPVYPEIAIQFGLQGGSYRFKTVNSYRSIDLTAFVQGCFDGYRAYGGQEFRFAELPVNINRLL
jgi:hypothetical protein